MNPKTLILLGIVTAAVVALAVLTQGTGGTAQGAEIGRPVLGDLMNRVNDVARVEVRRGPDSVTVRKQGDGWILEDVGGYPAEFETVKQNLLDLAALEIAARKTNKPDRHAEIGVADPSDDDATATLVTLSDADGDTLAELILGEKKPGQHPQVFVRRPGEDQAWLASGRVDFPRDAKSWLDQQILNIGADRIASVLVEHPDGERLSVYKTEKSQANYTLDEIPEGKQLNAPSTPNSLANALAYLSLEDVRPVSEIDFDAEAGATAEFRTWNGLVVTSHTAQQDEETWVRFDVRYEAPPQPAAPQGEGEDEDGEGAPPADEPDPEAARQEALELQEKLSPWAFRFPSYKQSNFTKQKDTMLRDVEPEGAEDGSAADPEVPFDAFSMDEGAEDLAPAEEPAATADDDGNVEPEGDDDGGTASPVEDEPVTDDGEDTPPATDDGSDDGADGR